MVLTLVGCSGVSNVLPDAIQSLDRRAEAERMAFPKHGDWSTGLITSRDSQILQAQRAKNISLHSPKEVSSFPSLAADRQVMLAKTADSTQTGRITGAPSWDYNTGKEWWLSDDGTVHQRQANIMTSWPIEDENSDPLVGETFPETYITYTGATYGFVCSKSNKIYSINMHTKETKDIYDMQGASTDIGFCPPPWVWGNSVYAVNNEGLLHRFTYNTSTGIMTLVSTLQLPRNNTSSVTEYYRSSPITYGGKLWIGSFRKNTNPNSHSGTLYEVDLATNSLTTNKWTVGPMLAPPSLEIEYMGGQWVPLVMFTPSNKKIAIIDLANTTNSFEQSPFLVVSDVDAASSTSGNPSSYSSSYGAGHYITNQVNINALDREVYVAACNAVFKLTYAAPDFADNDFSEDAFMQRAENFSTPSRVWYTLTHNGENQGPTDGTRYISNHSVAQFIPGTPNNQVFMLDNWGQTAVSSYTSITKFETDGDMDAPLVKVDAYDLTGNAGSEADANEVPGTYITYRFPGLLFSTTSKASASSPRSKTYVFSE